MGHRLRARGRKGRLGLTRLARAGNLKGQGMTVANKLQILSAVFVGAAIGMVVGAVRISGSQVEVHCAPAEDLESIDVALIDSARRSIDMAAYVLSDGTIKNALDRARARGVKLNLVVEETEIERDFLPKADSLSIRHTYGALMHLKAYAVDGKLLRTGSANFSYSGLQRQNNDLVIIRDKAAVEKFEAQFRSLMRE